MRVSEGRVSALTPELKALVEEYAPMAHSIAAQVWRQAPHALELDELTSLAAMGLVEAADMWEDYCERRDFDPNRLEYFKPYAQRRARGKILDTLRKQDHVQRSVRTRAKQLLEAGQDQGATEEQLAERTGMSQQEVRDTMAAAANRPVYLDAAEYDYHSQDDVESSTIESIARRTVVSTVRRLPAEQQAVLALHYFQNCELQEVARRLGITESRASHLHTAAVLEVHEALKAVVSDIEVRAE